MNVIGLTGGSGSGKSVVALELSKRKAYIIDADKIAHTIIQKGMPAYYEIVNYFGRDILDENQYILRKTLGNIVFQNKEKLEFLNQCTHGYIVSEIKKEIETAKQHTNQYSMIVIDAPLLIESGLTEICDEIWVVYAEEEKRILRIKKRDCITYQQAKNRILSQKKWEEYKKYADVIIDNSQGMSELSNQLDKLFCE